MKQEQSPGGPPSSVPILSVNDLSVLLKEVVEQTFPLVCVRGEISSHSKASSGHHYFTLKDEYAQVRAVMWRGRGDKLKFDLHDGLEVVALGPLEIYPARGSYQLVCHELWPEGIGGLELAFRQLQAKLEQEGLFDADRKRDLPEFPRKIAIVTSPTGAAIRDMLQVMSRRWPEMHVVIVPVAVQGEGAAAQIAQGLRQAALIPGVDVIITGRGGGSMEDLWPFNEEIVARAIYHSPIPVVTAVGHEIDITIADLVADRRALTPSEAAELVVPVKKEIIMFLGEVKSRLARGLWNRLAQARTLLNIHQERKSLAEPFRLITSRRQLIDDRRELLKSLIKRVIKDAGQQLANSSIALDALSPLKILGRGYSVTKLVSTGETLVKATGIRQGDQLQTQLAEGLVLSTVNSIIAALQDGKNWDNMKKI